ncbi:hypothetical protein SUGI_0996490 [Cryptomeria japonica]|nr:hypothetical protein SUGI_0996490 [Cryptomeria japonica]
MSFSTKDAKGRFDENRGDFGTPRNDIQISPANKQIVLHKWNLFYKARADRAKREGGHQGKSHQTPTKYETRAFLTTDRPLENISEKRQKKNPNSSDANYCPKKQIHM